MTRNDKLKANSDSNCEQTRQMTKKCKPKGTKPTKVHKIDTKIKRKKHGSQNTPLPVKIPFRNRKNMPSGCCAEENYYTALTVYLISNQGKKKIHFCIYRNEIFN
ncbi:unnamed protein product [Acanthoscelides obtectus]|uniref:Uncharacterized protein n=1 Tax=Acanthoscelides obtectus TaxID=200917 RepID=A0A9P0P7Z1_ACAOB|nr:unnamed protein product [Acanthoscelides obtectus]CAK1666904.1 hypothetical protein AOBTE_LOCUS25547 [Acanthoscelides obtectus]